MVFFYILFALIALTHLYACFFRLDKLRLATKPLLLASLALFYGFSAKPVNGFVLAALLCGLAGDIFLMLPRTYKSFVAGASVFSLGHALYSVALYSFIVKSGAAFSPWAVAAVALPYAAAAVIACAYIMPHVDKPFLRASMPGYFALIGLVGVGAWLALIGAAESGGGISGAPLLVAGGILFFVSDAILAKGVFVGEREQTNFYVMLTYIAAQFCLAQGFLRFL